MTRRPRAAEPDTSGLAHNVHGAGTVASAKRLLEQTRAAGCEWAVITEAQNLVPELRTHARRYGYDVCAETPEPRRPGRPIPEKGDTVLLVESRELDDWRTTVPGGTWMVRRYRRWHDPRRDQTAKLHDGSRVRGVHLPPGGPDDPTNGKAWRAQADHALRWVARHGVRTVVGDWNCSAERLERYVRDFAETQSRRRRRRLAKVALAGRGVDLAVAVDATVVATDLGRQRSDHPRVLYAVTARGRIRALRRWLRKRTRRARKAG